MECCPTSLQRLCKVAGYCRELEHTVVHVNEEHPKQAQWVTCLVSMMAMEEDIFSFQELCSDPCDMGLCIIMLKHEVMAEDEWHNNEPQDLVTESLFIQIAIDQTQLCSLSVAYICPYHNPSATMGHLTKCGISQQV